MNLSPDWTIHRVQGQSKLHRVCLKRRKERKKEVRKQAKGKKERREKEDKQANKLHQNKALRGNPLRPPFCPSLEQLSFPISTLL